MITTPSQPPTLDLNQPDSPNDTGNGRAKSSTDNQSQPPKKKKQLEEFRTRIDVCKIYRRKLVQNWTMNIDYRRGKPFASQIDEDRIVVNLDWSLTKDKQASLFSQVPVVHVDHPPESQSAGPWLEAFEQRLNDTLIVAGIETAMDEALPDCINASGFGAILCAHESISETVEISTIDTSTIPPQFLALKQLPDGSPIPTTTVPRIVDHRYTVNRISPADFLWPITFIGSDFDDAPWIGRSGRITWADAVQRFNLSEDDKDKVLGEDRLTMDRLTHDIDKDKVMSDEVVGFDEIFYKQFQYDSTAKSYAAIHHLVFVEGKDDPVIDEPWKGQQLDPTTNLYIGATRFPVRVLTLAYITDETIPPSDSAMGRPQVNEINKSRTQMILQRERSLPIRWFNVNAIDTTIQQSLMRGTWQGMIPVQGDGSRYIGEVARASMPQEDFTFDTIANNDLQKLWGLGPNQQGEFNPTGRTAAESNNIQQNYSTRLGRERAKVAKFVCTIAEVTGGLLAIYEPPGSFGQGFDPAISRTLNYSILADSTVLVDSNQRLQKITQFVNFFGKSGWLNLEPILKEAATLSGLDPNTVIVPPQPAPPVEPNISLRLTGVEDLLNPLPLAMMIKSGQAPSSDQIAQAKQLIADAVTPPPQMPGIPGVGPAQGGNPIGTPAAPPIPQVMPDPAPPKVGEANKDMTLMPKINKRSDQKGGR